MTAPEFSRPERIDTIGAGARTIEVAADAAERVALATRFALVEIGRLTGQFAVRREASGIVAQGRVQADVVQACVVTGDLLPVSIDEPVALCFVAEAETGEEEIELTPDALDIILFHGSTIDLGEAAAETMALALDPFPRGASAEAVLRGAGVLREEEVTRLSGLAGLKDLLQPKQG